MTRLLNTERVRVYKYENTAVHLYISIRSLTVSSQSSLSSYEHFYKSLIADCIKYKTKLEKFAIK